MSEGLSLTQSEREQVAEILGRRANEIAIFSSENRDKAPGSVELALTREIQRLRKLADKIKPPIKEDDEE